MRVNPHSLRAIRQRSGLSQAELARRVGLRGRAHLNNVELGRRSCSEQLIVRLADALQVPVLALVTGDSTGIDPVSNGKHRISTSAGARTSKFVRTISEQFDKSIE